MGENRLMHDLYEENQRLKARIEELESKHWNECGQIARYSDENAKLKELLRKAVEDVRCCMRSYDPCEICALLGYDGECPATDDDDCGEKYKWQHEAEALALIGEDTNVPASADGTNVGHKSGGWISCKDYMPDTLERALSTMYSDCCLVCDAFGWVGMAYYITDGQKSWWEFADAQNKNKIDWTEVTHWHPLPEPPKDGDT